MKILIPFFLLFFMIQSLLAQDTLVFQNRNTSFQKNNVKQIKYGNNIISIIPTDAFFSLASVGYERMFHNPHFSLKIPLSFGFKSIPDSTSKYYDDN